MKGLTIRFSPSSLESVAVLILLHSSRRKWQFVSSRLLKHASRQLVRQPASMQVLQCN